MVKLGDFFDLADVVGVPMAQQLLAGVLPRPQPAPKPQPQPAAPCR